MEDFKIKLHMTDVFIVIVVVALSAASLLFLPKQGTFVTVQWHGEQIYHGPLSVDTTVITPDGLNVVRIEDGRASMSSASCKDGTCVSMGCASPSRPVICLPNEVVIIITEKNDSEGVDSTTW